MHCCSQIHSTYYCHCTCSASYSCWVGPCGLLCPPWLCFVTGACSWTWWMLNQEAILKAIVCFHQLFSSFYLARKKVSSNRALPFNWVPEWVRKYTGRHLAANPELLTEKTWEVKLLWAIEILGGIVISVRLTKTVLFNFTHQILKIIYWKGSE